MASFTPFTGLEALKSSSRSSGVTPSGVIVDKTCRVYITKIPIQRMESEGGNALRQDFEVFGPIESYRLFTDKSGRFIGSALCTYRNPADAQTAVEQMHGKELTDGVPLEVSISNEHGVILLHQDRYGQNREQRKRFFRDGVSDSSDDRWSHDKYDELVSGKDMDEVLGIRTRHRGRGRGRWRGRGEGRQSRSDHIEAEFEKYIQARDAATTEKDNPPPVDAE